MMILEICGEDVILTGESHYFGYYALKCALSVVVINMIAVNYTHCIWFTLVLLCPDMYGVKDVLDQ